MALWPVELGRPATGISSLRSLFSKGEGITPLKARKVKDRVAWQGGEGREQTVYGGMERLGEVHTMLKDLNKRT